jgi:hypothetical protein
MNGMECDDNTIRYCLCEKKTKEQTEKKSKQILLLQARIQNLTRVLLVRYVLTRGKQTAEGSLLCVFLMSLPPQRLGDITILNYGRHSLTFSSFPKQSCQTSWFTLTSSTTIDHCGVGCW